MAKIGTAHVEIKPVLNEEALEALVKRIEDAVAQGVERALAARDPKFEVVKVQVGEHGTATYRQVIPDEIDAHERFQGRSADRD